jgi:hypothetical protein
VTCLVIRDEDCVAGGVVDLEDSYGVLEGVCEVQVYDVVVYAAGPDVLLCMMECVSEVSCWDTRWGGLCLWRMAY